MSKVQSLAGATATSKKPPSASQRVAVLNEKPLHAALKEWYSQPGDRLESSVEGFVVDIVRGHLLIEIQTGNFAAIRRKLAKLTVRHRVRLVYPIAQDKWIIKLAEEVIGSVLGLPISVWEVEVVNNRSVDVDGVAAYLYGTFFDQLPAKLFCTVTEQRRESGANGPLMVVAKAR
jgi:hypothetical protein